MISTKNRKTQCKETEQLYEQLKNNLSDNVAAFSEKYSKFAVKRLLLYHFGKGSFLLRYLWLFRKVIYAPSRVEHSYWTTVCAIISAKK